MTEADNNRGSEAIAEDLKRVRDDLVESERRFKEIAELLPGIICEMVRTEYHLCQRNGF